MFNYVPQKSSKRFDSMNNDIETTKPNPFWLRPSNENRCAARSKRSGEQCKNFALRGKRVCRIHGGLSSGPKVPAVKHGLDSLEAIKERLLQRVKATAAEERKVFEIEVEDWIASRVLEMNYAEFRHCRKTLSDFANGRLPVLRVVEAVDVKPITTKSEGRKKI